MKNLSLALNVVLIAAVGFLYYKVYSKPGTPAITTQHALPESAIVFVNSDSLLNNYDLFNVLKINIEAKQDSIDRLLKGRANDLEREIQIYQKQAIGMTDMEKQQTEERLMQKQQALMQLKEELLGMLGDEEAALNDSIHNNLIGYLREFNTIKNYNYILGYQKGGGILLANDALDITGVVLEGLNARK